MQTKQTFKIHLISRPVKRFVYFLSLHGHGWKKRDEFNCIYYSLCEALQNVRTTSVDFYQILQSQNSILKIIYKEKHENKNTKNGTGVFLIAGRER